MLLLRRALPQLPTKLQGRVGLCSSCCIGANSLWAVSASLALQCSYNGGPTKDGGS